MCQRGLAATWANSTAPALPYLRESGISRSPPVPSLLYDSKVWRLPSDILQLITFQEGTTECLSATVELRQTIDKQQSKKMFGVEYTKYHLQNDIIKTLKLLEGGASRE
jgi:hypothetical protein